MPTRIRKRTIAEIQENRRGLSRLREMGVDVGSNDALLPQFQAQKRLRLEPVDEESATIFTRPGHGFILVAPARLIVLASRVLILDFEMTAPWDELPLELEGPEEFSFYRDVVEGFYPFPLTILNPWLIGERPLYCSQRKGLVIARGQSSIPRECAEGSWLKLELSLRDHKDNELRCEFRGRVDHKLKRSYERLLRKQYPYRQPREPLFGRDGALRNDEKPVSQTTGFPLQPSQRQTDMIKKI